MSILDEIKPRSKERVIDLVEKAGFDISDWANTTAHPSQNPKYRSEWCFTDPHRGIILNLWHPQFEEKGGVITREGNFRDDELHLTKTNWKIKARDMDAAVKMSWERKLPIQVIMLDGDIRKLGEDTPSKPHFRSLDKELWHVEHYNNETGAHRLVRGAQQEDSFIDQFSSSQPLPTPLGNKTPERKPSSSNSFPRDRKVRGWVLARAKGSCEYCGEKGFKTSSGHTYLETHHIIALCDDGPDLVTNVIALCPNHHREAHYGENSDELRQAFFKAIIS